MQHYSSSTSLTYLADVRVRAVSAAGDGEWSAVQTERTYFDGELLHYLLFTIKNYKMCYHNIYLGHELNVYEWLASFYLHTIA